MSKLKQTERRVVKGIANKPVAHTSPSKRLHKFVMKVFSFYVENKTAASNLGSVHGAISDVNAIQKAERFNNTRKLLKTPRQPIKRKRKFNEQMGKNRSGMSMW